MTDDLPTLKEELERKTVEVLSQLDHRIRSGSIDPRGAWVTAQTVWTLTAGLVSNEASQAAADIANQNPCPNWKRVFVHDSKPTLLLRVAPSRGFALTHAITSAVLKKGLLEPGDLGSLDKVVEALKSVGYTEI